jgi:RNA polymerase-binding transcription factor DksA
LGAQASPPGREVPARWRWHHGVLLSLQSRLLQEAGVLRAAGRDPLEPHSLSEADSATDEFDHDLALGELSAETDLLYEVNEALRRIHDGSYGVCGQSGRPIPPARLRAVPWARFAKEVEEQLESRGGVAPARVRRAGTVRARGRIWLAAEEEAEEREETPSPAAKDEAMTHLYSPPGQHLRRRGGGPRNKAR